MENNNYKWEDCLDIEKVFIEPDFNRAEFHNGEIDAACYEFVCPRCMDKQELDFMTLFHNAHNWRSRFTRKDVLAIEECFNIGPIPMADMTPSINQVHCNGCDEDFLVYIGITHLGLDDCYHSVFKLTEQGVSLISL
jgi:hypothetical protein